MASENETVAEVLAEFGKNIELMRKCKCEKWRKALEGDAK